MKSTAAQKISSYAVLAIAIGLLVVGATLKREIELETQQDPPKSFRPSQKSHGIPRPPTPAPTPVTVITVEQTPDWQLVVNATFGNVTLDGERLLFLQDPSKVSGAQPCPT